ncbi:MAG: hypothetical protein FWH04_01755 [Oscillospiraceae bacterium]|nr:hypothetical protein [Oscillospiraceae bacterium]
MKSLEKRFAALHSCAQLIALTGLRLTICLLFCNLLLTLSGNPFSYDTYFKYQLVGVVNDVIRSVLILSTLGTIWMQYLHSRKGNGD